MQKLYGEDINKEKAPEWKNKLHEVIFEADTPMGKLFDVILLWAILLSVLAVMLETVDFIRIEYGLLLYIIEWTLTGLFTVEYLLRLISVAKPIKYATSFMGIIDLLSTIPTYIGLFIAGPQYMLVLRTVRLLRVFRILKLRRYVSEAQVLINAIKSSIAKITVFIGAVVIIVLIIGTVMYIVEGPSNGFTSIPYSMYWTIVTITTVGYGDISPQTALGQTIASFVMLLGYGIIAVPTGIVTSELNRARNQNKEVSNQSCPACSKEGHDTNAKHCKHCGAVL
jgi:voltage-gated potassium channel